MRALLWDLDGTLTSGKGGGSRALGKALHAKPRAVDHLRDMRLDGMTDRAIARILLTVEHAEVSEQDIDDVLAQYLSNLETICVEKPYEPLPGIKEILRHLETRSLLGLCTGNVERGAEIKLRSAGLWGPFKFGGYGSDAEQRADIVRIAWKRAQALGATSALVIGDTPRDILAAHEAGLKCCAVATGRFTIHELAENGADIVLEDFSDAAKSMSLILE